MHKDVPIVQSDMTDAALLGSIVSDYGIETVVNRAAQLDISASMADPLQYYSQNAVKTCRHGAVHHSPVSELDN